MVVSYFWSMVVGDKNSKCYYFVIILGGKSWPSFHTVIVLVFMCVKYSGKVKNLQENAVLLYGLMEDPLLYFFPLSSHLLPCPPSVVTLLPR